MIAFTRTLIREPKRVARLSRTFSQSLSAVDLAEPLLSLDDNQPAAAGADLLRARGVGVLGVRRAGAMAGWVRLDDLGGGTLGDCLHEFQEQEVFSDHAGLVAILSALSETEHVFLEWLGEITAVITRRDLQKPPLRMWLFGAITVLDTNMSWAIEELYPGDSWRDQISKGRWEKASVLYAERQRHGTECRMVDCLQIKDKADILAREPATLTLLGLASRREVERFTGNVEKLRNHLAHAQVLEPGDLATAGRLASFIDAILSAGITKQLVELQHQEGPGRPSTRDGVRTTR
ncbi:conserved hypothetical protein [Chthoniobacter flavus Ellin428]|uniref:CBS domain-containing protein n=1 Tax=Chthoniobacter flavus Ellin428 TaxID=497964 RepID=B4CX50_9BACT|nr:hypothetical protein [Chthoniobacter flavus]EDY20848.1 conserved hypothetical protein [Chthoniobacter flavus Ellin428]TCO85660.1 hypothetical protein EV701_13043 [Chthoniobacter flavus]